MVIGNVRPSSISRTLSLAPEIRVCEVHQIEQHVNIALVKIERDFPVSLQVYTCVNSNFCNS